MKKKVTLVFEIDDITNRNYLFAIDGEDLVVAADETEKAAKLLKTSPQLLVAINEAFDDLASSVAEKMQADLKSLWDKIEKLEERLK